jgi:predicted RNase H-like HicB family nuclease
VVKFGVLAWVRYPRAATWLPDASAGRLSNEVNIPTATYTAIIEYDEEARMYVGSIPELPGAHTQAMTLEELRDNLNEVAGLVIADMVEHGETPAASRFIGTLQISTGIS